MGTPLAFAVSWTTSGEALYALVAAQLRGGQADPEAPPPHEAPVTAPPEDEPDATATGDDGAHDGANIVTFQAPEVGIDRPPAAQLARGAQWRLHYTSMTVGQLGQDPMGAVIPCTSAPCEFGAPKLGSLAGGGSSTYRCDCGSSAATLASGRSNGGGSSSGGGSSGTSRPVVVGGGTSSLAARDDAPPPETMHIVLEWLPEAFEPLGSFEKAKLESALGAGDANHRYGIQAGHKPLSEKNGAAVGVDLLQCLELFSREETLDADNAWYCPQCKEHREACKKIQVCACSRALVRAAVLICMRACSRACTRAHMCAHVHACVVCRCAPISPQHPNLPTCTTISRHTPQSPRMHLVCGWHLGLHAADGRSHQEELGLHAPCMRLALLPYLLPHLFRVCGWRSSGLSPQHLNLPTAPQSPQSNLPTCAVLVSPRRPRNATEALLRAGHVAA